MTWPPDYTQVYKDRDEMYDKLCAQPELWEVAKKYYAQPENCAEFIQDWCITHDPRNKALGLPTIVPFILFERQKELIEFLLSCIYDEENALIEKCRDMGVSWICVCVAVWFWVFHDDIVIGFGSNKAESVDKIGDPKSLFHKIRKTIEYLPKELLPEGFDDRHHMSYMKAINPVNGSAITGEAGDNIGRGGRTLFYIKDESAHYERPEDKEAALGDNTNVQIDVSSVNGTDNVFYRRRQAGVVWPEKEPGKVRVFILDWRQHPAKTQEWYNKRRAKAESEGLLHKFKQEVDRDYTGSVENTVIQDEWVQAAIDLHKKIDIDETGMVIAGLDIADEGQDKNALAVRKGICLNYIDDWAQGDTGATARKALGICKQQKVTSLQYDSIGVGAGVKAETNRLKDEDLVPKGLSFVKWNASAAVLIPKQHLDKDRDMPKWEDFAANLKSQGWWCLRQRFLKTYQVVNEGANHPQDELICLKSSLNKIYDLTNELTQVTFTYDGKGKLLIKKTPSGKKSPNLADAVMMVFWPIQKAGFFA